MIVAEHVSTSTHGRLPITDHGTMGLQSFYKGGFCRAHNMTGARAPFCLLAGLWSGLGLPTRTLHVLALS